MAADDIKKFIKSNGLSEPIDICEEIANWNIQHNGNAPTILVDLNKILRMLVVRDQMGLILGGRYDGYNKMMLQFLRKFTNAGAKMVFFLPGRQYSDELPFFILRTEEAYIESLEILDTLEQKSDLKAFLKKKNCLHTHAQVELSFDYNLKKLVNEFGVLHLTNEEHNQEIACYANQYADNILALITEDMNFMAFNGSYEFWRAKSINFKSMTCHRYNKNRLYENLGFEHGPLQMQLFNALCQSVFLPLYVISDFLSGLADQNMDLLRRGKIWDVSAYVKRQPLTTADGKLTYDLDKIGRDVFGGNVSREQLNSILNGLVFYDLDFIQPSKRNLSPFLKRCGGLNSFAYKLATDSVFIIEDISLVDFRNYKSKSYAELVIPILMKLCGILFKGNACQPTARKICMKHAHDEPSKVTEELIVYPSMRLPSLAVLVFETRLRQLDKIRWKLLECVLNLDDGIMNKMDKMSFQKLRTVIITLQYLVQDEITPKEANIILYTEHQIRIKRGEKKPAYPKVPNAHCVRIAHLYVKMYVLISHCLSICGLFFLNDLLRFDGVCFLENMEKFNFETEPLENILESDLKPIWVFS